jgi:hypothetical protein
MSSRNTTMRISLFLLARGQLFAHVIATTAPLSHLASTAGGVVTDADVSPSDYERVTVLSVNKDDDVAYTLVYVRPRSALGVVRLGEASFNSEAGEARDISVAGIPTPVSKRGRYAIVTSLNTTTNQPGIWTITIAPPTAVDRWLVLEVAVGGMLISLLLCLFAVKRTRRKREERCRNML